MGSKMGKKPTVRLYITGNCGNQFFQYAFARSIQEKLDGDLVVNYFRIRNDDNIMAESDNLLSLFSTAPYRYESKPGFGGLIFRGLKFVRIIFGLRDFQKRTYRFYLWCARVLSKFGIVYFDAAYYPLQVPANRRNIYINGYFESPRYFESIDDKICSELQPINELLPVNKEQYRQITGNESVCVTIKRMDVDNEEIADIYEYDISYFYNAMDYIASKVSDPVFVIFSDDIDWCRNNIRTNYRIIFENEGNPIWEKIRLMSSCKHFIIHNSTFSWWAQHLSDNPNKIVVAPSVWMLRYDQPIDIYEDNWVYLNKEGTIMHDHE